MGEGDWQFLKYSPLVGSRDSHMILRTFQATAQDTGRTQYSSSVPGIIVPWRPGGREGTVKVPSHYFGPHGQEQDKTLAPILSHGGLARDSF